MAQKTTRRILIINWKWKCLKDYQINEHYLRNIHIDDFFNQKEKYPFYETLRVGRLKDKKSNKSESELPKQIPLSFLDVEKGTRIICCSIYRGKKSRQLLNRLIEEIHKKYSESGDKVEIMLFLHRGHHYDYNDVLSLLEEQGKYMTKCFLFETGRDFIYYHAEKKGLLDHIGRFYRGRQGKDNKVLRTYYMAENVQTKSKQEKIIKLWYFNNVWQYYKQEFKRKLKTLYIDFVNSILGLNILHLQKEMDKEDLIAYLEGKNTIKEGLIYYRIKSFLGCYDSIEPEGYDLFNPPSNEEEIDLLDEEIGELKKFEKKRKQSYTFDDVRANLKHVHINDDDDQKAHDLYEELYGLMSVRFLRAKEFEKKITLKDIQKIRKKMNELVAILPGENL